MLWPAAVIVVGLAVLVIDRLRTCTGAVAVAVAVTPPLVPCAVTELVKPAVIFVLVHVYVVEAPTARLPRLGFEHDAARASVVDTVLNGTSPVFVTVIVQVVVPPGATIVGEADLVTDSSGTWTTVVSVLVRSAPRADLPATVAELTSGVVVAGPVQVYVKVDPVVGATGRLAMVRAQPGASASVTVSPVSATLPELTTEIV